MNERMKASILACGALLAATLVAGRTLAAEAPVGTEPGVWQLHELTFDYMGFTSTYSCDGLADQLRRLLLLSGARADVQAEPGACAASFGQPDKFARAKLSFYTLAPRGAATGAGEAVAGHWQSVDVTAHHPFEIATGDCELVEQFRDRILKKLFTTRNLVDGTTCVPHQESGSLIDLRFEAFTAVAGAVPLPLAAASPERVFAYPKQGQNAAQQAADRAACEAAASVQSGVDPAAPGADRARAHAYTTALAGCLEGRGYSVH